MNNKEVGFAVVLSLAFICLLIGTATDSWGVYEETTGSATVSFRVSFFSYCVELECDPESFYCQNDETCYTYQVCDCYDDDGDREKTCDKKNDEDAKNFENCDETSAGQAFALMAVISSFVAACAAGAFAFKHVNRSREGAAIFALIAAICGLISMAIWANWMDDSDFDEVDYGYSFGLFTAGWILAAVGCGMAAVIGK